MTALPATRHGGPMPHHAIRVVFYGRVDGVDDRLDLRRQLSRVRAALPDEVPIVGYFADTAAWKGRFSTNATTRVFALDGHQFDGGLIDLLDFARRTHAVDIIACADMSRISRRLVDLWRIEDYLAPCGTTILDADNPLLAAPHLLDLADPAQRPISWPAFDVAITPAADSATIADEHGAGVVAQPLQRDAR